MIPCRPNYIEWSDLKRLGIDLSQGPEFDSKEDLVRRLELQLRREFASKSVYGSQNHIREEKTRLSTSSEYEHPSLGTEYNDKEDAAVEERTEEKVIKALSESTQIPSELIKKGDEFYEEGLYQEAIIYYDRELRIGSGSELAWLKKGNALNRLGKYEEAIKCYDKAIEIDPSNYGGWNNKGLALRNLGKHKEAIKYYDKAIEIDPNNGLFWNNKAISLEDLGDKKHANECYKKARELGYKG